MKGLRADLVVLVSGWTLLSCAGSDAGHAALGTGVMVGAVGVNRAATGDCWAHCSPGYVCNQESGLCEKGECYPACDAGYHCAATSMGQRCLSDAVAVSGLQLAPSPAPSTGQTSVVTPGQVQIPRGSAPPAPAPAQTGLGGVPPY